MRAPSSFLHCAVRYARRVSTPRAALKQIAWQAMRDRGFEPDYPAAAIAQANQSPENQSPENEPALPAGGRRDLRDRLWCSIDNEESRDLDQLTVAEERRDGIGILVAIADVDALVPRDSPVDRHASKNTTSVYTAAEVFAMLPERLSTDLTSLGEAQDRAAVVIDMTIDADGEVIATDAFPALVRNRAKLAYPSVGAWLEGAASTPAGIEKTHGLAANLQLQDAAARALKQSRHRRGALTLDTTEGKPVFSGDEVRDIAAQHRTRASELIEDFMIAANTATAKFLEARGFASLRRIVRMPERWPRIVALAAETGTQLPAEPDQRALERWLLEQRASDPARFADLSLAVVKLLGRGE